MNLESVDENVEDQDIIDVHGEYIANPINSDIAAGLNSPESGNMEDSNSNKTELCKNAIYYLL